MALHSHTPKQKAAIRKKRKAKGKPKKKATKKGMKGGYGY